MRQAVLQYIIVLVVFLAIDAAWLSTAARSVYVPEIGQLMRPSPNFLVAILFYIIFAFGLLVFVVSPQVPVPGFSRSFMLGALFGFVAYATYDMTNLATMKGFTAKIAVIDMIWGTILSAAVSALSVWLIRLFKLG